MTSYIRDDNVRIRTYDRRTGKTREDIWNTDTKNVEIAKASALFMHSQKYRVDVSEIKYEVL